MEPYIDETNNVYLDLKLFVAKVGSTSHYVANHSYLVVYVDTNVAPTSEIQNKIKWMENGGCHGT